MLFGGDGRRRLAWTQMQGDNSQSGLELWSGSLEVNCHGPLGRDEKTGEHEVRH